MRRIIKIGVTVVIFALITELALRAIFYGGHFLGIYILPYPVLTQSNLQSLSKLANGQTKYMAFDRDLGWSIQPDAKSEGGLYQSNKNGMRSNREYTEMAPAGVLRVATYGDSFCHCDDVDNRSTWQSFMEEADPLLELLNFGVMGFGTDQSLMRFRQSSNQWSPRVVVIGFMVENIARNVNRFPPFLTPENIPLAKPRFLLERGALQLLRTPDWQPQDYLRLTPDQILETISVNDQVYSSACYEGTNLDLSYMYRLGRTVGLLWGRMQKGEPLWAGFYEQESVVELSFLLLKTFGEEAAATGAQPLIVIFPDRYALESYGRGGAKRWEPLLSKLRNSGIPYVDLTEPLHETVFGSSSKSELFIPHYSRALNRQVAAVFVGEIRKIAGSKQ